MLLNLPLGKCFQRFNQSILFTLTRRNLNTISLEIQEFCCTKLKQKKAFTPTRRNLQTISSDVQSHWHNKLTQAKVESPDVSIREIKKCVEANYPVILNYLKLIIPGVISSTNSLSERSWYPFSTKWPCVTAEDFR